MKAEKLRGRDFRNLLPFEIEFSPGMNVIYGNNAQGKTNFIEALWLFTGAKSFRGAKDGELVAFGQKDSELLLDFVNGGVKDCCKNGYMLEDDPSDSYCYPSVIGTKDGLLVSYYHSNGTKFCLKASKIITIYRDEFDA